MWVLLFILLSPFVLLAFGGICHLLVKYMLEPMSVVCEKNSNFILNITPIWIKKTCLVIKHAVSYSALVFVVGAYIHVFFFI